MIMTDNIVNETENDDVEIRERDDIEFRQCEGCGVIVPDDVYDVPCRSGGGVDFTITLCTECQ